VHVKSWSEKEIQYLKQSYKKVATDTIASKLGRTVQAVHKKASRLKLKKDKRFYATNINDPSIKSPPSQNLVYLLGVLKGDASFTRGKKGMYPFQLTTKDKPFAKKVSRRLKDINLNPSLLQTGRGYWEVTAYSVKLYEWVNSKNIYSILNSGKRAYKFLEGLYESDGSLRYGEEPRFDSTDEETINLIKYLLENLGFSCVIGESEKSSFYVATKRGEGVRFFRNIDCCIKRRTPNELIQDEG